MDAHSMSDTGKLVMTALGSGGGASLVPGVLGWLRQRRRDNSLSRELVEKAAQELIKTALAASKQQLDAMAAECTASRAENAELRREIDELRDKVEDLEEQHADCRRETGRLTDETTRLQAEIHRLMTGPVATYGPGDLKRPAEPRRRKSRAKPAAKVEA